MILGWMADLELFYIQQWAKKVPKNGVIVEIGSFMGKSAVCWATHCDPTVKVYCVDKFDEDYRPTTLISSKNQPENTSIPHNGQVYNVYESFLENTACYKNIIPLRGNLPSEILYPGDAIDLLFVDLSHTNPIDWDSILFFKSFMKSNSIICGHDYTSLFPDVVENAKQLSEMYGNPVECKTNTLLWSVKVNT